MAIMGLRNTEAFNTPGGRRPQNYREAILMLYPNGGGIEKAPLTALTAVMKSQATDDPVYHWFTKKMQDRRLKLAGSLNNTDVAGSVVSITVDSTYATALGLKAGDLLMTEQTSEVLYVNATPSSAGQVNVVRGFALPAGTALSAVTYNGAGVNPYLKIMGSAFEEGSAAPDPIAFDPVEKFNQCQIFRGTYGLTNTAREVNTRTGSEEKESKREALEIFGLDMEAGFFFGQKTTTIRNGQPLRTTDGVLNTIPANRRFTPTNGVLTMDWLENISTEMFRYGATEKMAFCGSTFLNAVAKMVRKNGTAQYDLGAPVKEYGMGGIRRLTTPNGTLVLKIHPMFSQMTSGTNNGASFTSMDNAAVILDMGNLNYRFLRNRDVQFQDKLTLPGVDGMVAGWIGECGLEMHHEYTHALLTGVTTGGADA